MCKASLHSILVMEPWIYDGVTRAFFQLQISLSTKLEIHTARHHFSINGNWRAEAEDWTQDWSILIDKVNGSGATRELEFFYARMH